MSHVSRFIFLFCLGALLVACNTSTDPAGDSEFTATLDNFKDYKNWELVDTQYGPDPLLQTAHGTTDGVVRRIYVKDNAQPQNGNYANGTLILKETSDFEGTLVGAITVMAKRGNGFNPDGNGWEWFMASPDLSQILTQGDNATAGGGMCATCHAGANTNGNGTDWVFNHPNNEEYVATLDDFKDYLNWAKVDSRFGPDPLLSTAHGVQDSLYRNIYIKDGAKAIDGSYLRRTLIVKELRDGDGALQGAITMMAKRGGDFNPDGNGWEWFMASTDLTQIITQGDNATAGSGMCASCHAGANTNNNGTDWVFNHPKS